MTAIKGFQKEYRWLSNFWPAAVMLEGIQYSSVEHAYQAAKDPSFVYRMEIRSCEKAGDAKRMGKQAILRNDWEKIKIATMLSLLREKFGKNEELKKKLLATGTAYLEETNTWGDTFWGVCNGEGQNFLGFLLMFVRYELKQKAEK